MKNGKRWYMTPERLQAAQRALAEQLARKVTGNAMVALGAAAAMKGARRVGPKGLGLRSNLRNLYALNATEANGYAKDPVLLNRIPKTRAVKVGMQTFDARTLRKLFRLNPNATHPVTRQPFPPNIRAKYGGSSRRDRFIHQMTVALGASRLSGLAETLWRASLATLFALGDANSKQEFDQGLENVQRAYGVEIDIDDREVEVNHAYMHITLQHLLSTIHFNGPDRTMSVVIYSSNLFNDFILFEAEIGDLDVQDALRDLGV